MEPETPRPDAAELAAATDEALWWTLVAQAARERADRERERLDALMVAYRSLAQESSRGRGTVTRVGGKDVAVVSDPFALLRWTQEHRPSEVVPSLRPAWVDFVKRLALTKEGPIDPQTGQLIPGVTTETSARTVRVNGTPEAREAARRFLGGLRRLNEETDDV